MYENVVLQENELQKTIKKSYLCLEEEIYYHKSYFIPINCVAYTELFKQEKKNQQCVNPSLHMYSFTLEESDFMRTKENCIKRSKMVLTVYLTFSGQKKNTLETLIFCLKLIVVMTSKPV